MSDVDFSKVELRVLKAIIADGLKIDVERIDLQRGDEKVRVGISGLTEPEQRGINMGLRQMWPEASFEVVEDPAPDKVKRYNLETLTALVGGMKDAPDSQLDEHYAAQCGVFAEGGHDLEETLRFIRDMRDKCVFTAGASSFVMRLWSYMLEDYPEPDDVKAERRKKLERWAGI